MSKDLHRELTDFLKKNIDQKYKQNYLNFFKQDIILYGVRSELVNKVVRNYYKEIKFWSFTEQLKFVYKLLESGYQEEILIALKLLYKLESKLNKEHFKILEDILSKYIHNWATCDEYCLHIFGSFLYKHPDYFFYIKNNWSVSQNLWIRRASAVSLIYSIKTTKTKNQFYLHRSFLIANILLSDEQDLVQKGYGWLLKEASNYFPYKVFEFVNHLKTHMPRTALRYALEKMPKSLKREAMTK